MTTDPRIAALAEVLREVIDDGWYYRDLYKSRPSEDAAAILAALPPDWCGHADEEYNSRISRMIAEQDAIRIEHTAEIARLRPIEEAARVVCECYEGFCGDGTLAPPLTGAQIAALRAALGEAERGT